MIIISFNLVPVCRPIINNFVDFSIKYFSLYRHKYATTTSHSINSQSDSGNLSIELDGQAIIFKSTTVKQFRSDLSTTKRVNIDSIRIWEIEYVNDEKNEKRSLLSDAKVLDSVQRTSALLVELRKPDLSWPEDLADLAKGKTISRKTDQAYEYTGLINVGNSCYLNAALQALCSTELLKEYFDQGLAQWETNDTNQNGYSGKLVANFSRLIIDLSRAAVSSFAPTQLRYVLASKNLSLCREGDQQDSVELLQVLLDGLHEDLNRVRHKVENDSIPDSDGREDSVVSLEHWNLHKKQHNSIIVDLFHLQLKSSVQCQKCSFTSSRFQSEVCLHLPVPTDNEVAIIWFYYDQHKTSIVENVISLHTKGKLI